MPIALPPEETATATSAPQLLVELPSWSSVFLTNLRDLVSRRPLPPLEIHSAPAPFWADVFVTRRLPWRRFLESAAGHILAFAILAAGTRFFALRPQAAPLAFDPHNQVTVYEPSEYLPRLNTRQENPRKHALPADPSDPAKPDPELSRQVVISLPPERDNRSQTVVTPPAVKLKRDAALPNIVRWSDKAEMPRLAIPDAPLTPAAEITRVAPHMENSVVAPPPDLRVSRAAATFAAPQPSVIAPAPSVERVQPRRLGEMEIARSAVIAPAPQLQVEAQRAVPGGRTSAAAGMATKVVAPPPAFSGSGSPGRVIALNLHPAVGAPPVPPPGNRRGAFAATPEGHPGASGSPGKENGSGSSQRASKNLPAGLYVGNAPARTSPVAGDPGPVKPTVNPNLLASARTPRVSARNTQPDAAKLSEAERAVFGNRKFYSLTLSMPNLNSAGGSWIVRFAELDHAAKSPSSAAASGAVPGDAPADTSSDLSQPAATRKVDPGYPIQLMRENVAGTVILYAIIRADGSVASVRVLRGVDDRIDRLAREAVAQWQFQPAMKNGSPVAVEATFQIPFHPPNTSF
jgi:TonB family protein